MNNDLEIKLCEQVNEIIMTLPDRILVLEGKTDKMFIEYNQFNCKNKYNLFTVENVTGENNKEKVINILKDFQSRGNQVLGLIDKDYDAYENNVITMENLYYYKENDLESTLFISKNFESLFKLVAKQNFSLASSTIVSMIKKAIKPISILRYINHSTKMGYQFDNVKYSNFFDWNSMKNKDEKSIVRYIYQRLSIYQEHRITFEREYLKYSKDYIELIRGHDLLKMFVEFINKKMVNHVTYDEGIVLKMLIISYGIPDSIDGDIINNHIEKLFFKSAQ